MLKLRQSIFSDYDTCPRICYKNWGNPYEEGESEKHREEYSNKYASVGTAIHETMEWHGIEKKEERNPTRLQIHDILDVRFGKIPVDLFENEEDKEEFYNSAHEQIDWLYDNFRDKKPLLTEFTFSLDNLIEGLPPFEGTVDRVEGSITNKQIDLIDFKSGRVYTKKELKSNIQATIYSLAWKKIYGTYPERFVFYFSKYNKIKTIVITPDFIDAGLERIKAAWLHMVNGDFNPPLKPNKFFCHNFCKFKEDCPRNEVIKGWEAIGYY